jgi:hypothetical protein
MARARKVVSDQNSQELDELRRQFNNLLLVLEGTTSFATLQTAIVAGNDTVTGVDINGVRPTPLHPRRPRNLDTENMNSSSDY